MPDNKTTIHELKLIVESFVDEREWKQFHSPKNLAMSLSIEAAELMEIFQFRTDQRGEDAPLPRAHPPSPHVGRHQILCSETSRSKNSYRCSNDRLGRTDVLGLCRLRMVPR